MYSRISSVAIGLATLLLATAVSAQNVPFGTAGTTEQVTIGLGDIFEILPSTDFQDPEYSWILTQDRTFVQAGRSNVFRYRFIEPKTYTLIGSIRSAEQADTVQRTFVITVAADGEESSSAQSASGATKLVSTDPPMNLQEKVVVADGSMLVKLLPENPDVKPLALDLNTAVDTDGDGSPGNDLDDEGTYFHSDATPLYVWLSSLQDSVKLSVTSAGGAGGALRQDVEVMTESYAMDQGYFVSPVTVTATPLSSSEFDFTAELDASITDRSSLLYQWDFGDGEESLLTSPRHAYSEPGSYTAVLRVKNLQTGEDVGTANIDIEVSSISTGTVSSESSSSAESQQPSNGGPGILAGLMGWIPWIILLVVSLMIGALCVFLYGRFVKKKPLSDTFESMESKILDQKADTSAKNPPPLAIKKSPSPAPAPANPPKPAQNATAQQGAPVAKPLPEKEMPVDTENAPDWLKKGIAQQSPSAPAAQPKPVAQPPAAPKAPTPAPQQQSQAKPNIPPVPQAPKTPAPQQAPKQPNVNAPQPARQQPRPVPRPPVPQAPKAPAAPAPKPQQQTPRPPVAPTPKAPTPSPAPTQAATPQNPTPAQPAPAQQEEKVPDWLKQGLAQQQPSAPAAPQPATPPQAPAAPAQPETAATPPPAEQKPLTEGQDEPIAIIRAESLNPQQPQNPSQS